MKKVTWTGYRCRSCHGSSSSPGDIPFTECPFCHSSDIGRFDSNTDKKPLKPVSHDKCELKDLLKCPFCGGVVSEHPNKKYRGFYFVIYHDTNCYMNADEKPPFNFTLLPKNHLLKQWNRRIYHHF